MKATLIGFSEEMIEAIHQGRKTQTRRPVQMDKSGRILACRYGEAGDLLRIRGSLITLDITDVRVERLQSITNADAEAEGVEPELVCCQRPGKECCGLPDAGYVGGFRQWWASLYGEYSWDENPWVWVISFRRIEK